MIVGSDDNNMNDANIENANMKEAIAEAKADTNNNDGVGLNKVNVLHSLDFISLPFNCLGYFKVLKFKK
ncbi:3904_t:CDS:1, partial [Cetraspora pellucida]